MQFRLLKRCAAQRCLTGTALLVASIAASCAAARAAPLPRAGDFVSYAVIDQDVRDVVAGIAGQIGLRSDIAPKIAGRVHGRLTPATAQDTLDRLGALYGFDWYCDGRTLFVTPYAEAQHKVLPLAGVSGTDLTESLEAFGIEDSRWPVRLAPSGDVALVDGPPHYVALVEDTLAALAGRAHQAIAEVHVFRGASASGS